MKNFLITLLIIAVFVLASLVSIDGAPAATKSSCHTAILVSGKRYYAYVTRTVRASCPFARNVTRNALRFIVRAGGAGDGDFFIFAYSPVTHKNYRMHCWANGSLYDDTYGMRGTCRGGVGARVSFRAWD